ncbi:MAG TPA: hypothetical protein VK620_00920 [Bradyrhizobium sp.]|jgi:hypothetical protein|nr:hypothetical protein [Bradyrhizobium sp.]
MTGLLSLSCCLSELPAAVTSADAGEVVIAKMAKPSATPQLAVPVKAKLK